MRMARQCRRYAELKHAIALTKPQSVEGVCRAPTPRQFLYFCASQASKLSAFSVSICTFLLVVKRVYRAPGAPRVVYSLDPPTSVRGLKLLVYEALGYKLLVYKALSY